MALRLKASKHVGNGFPPEEGKKLAEALIKINRIHWNNNDGVVGPRWSINIDLHRLPAAMLISSFFREFYHHLLQENPVLFAKARDFTWYTDHDFQLDNIKLWYEWVEGELNIAQRARQRLEQLKTKEVSRKTLSNFRDQCLDTATCNKNRAIWLVAFKYDPPMLKRLRNAQQQLSNLQGK